MRKVVLITFLFLALFSTAYASEFSDVSGHWAYDYINRMIVNNVISGYPDGTFKPNNFVKVNEFLKILVEASGYKKVMKGENWSDWYVNSALKYGFILEDEFDSYDREISRYEVARIVARYINVSDMPLSKNIFSDLDSKNKSNVLKLVSLGVANGYKDNTFRGDNYITRAESLKIVYSSIKARKNCILNREYDLIENKNLSNQLGRDLNGTCFINHYSIENRKIYIYDTGRYSVLNRFLPSEQNIKNNVLLKLMKAIVMEDTFVGLSYIPNKFSGVNEIIISTNTTEGYLYNGSYNFSFKFYENGFYELSRISMIDEFSNNCFMKISVLGLWDDLYDYKNGIYMDEFYVEQFRRGVIAVLGEECGAEFMELALAKIKQSNEKEYGTQIAEVANVGEYTVNVYSSGSVGIDFYFCK